MEDENEKPKVPQEYEDKDEDSPLKEDEEKELLEPPQFLEKFQNQQVEQGATCFLNVRIHSNNNDNDVKWLCGDEVITSSARFGHMTVVSDNDLHSLVINDIRLLDTAQYTCMVSNEAGVCQCTADVLVLRK